MFSTLIIPQLSERYFLSSLVHFFLDLSAFVFNYIPSYFNVLSLVIYLH
nr:MAG TPA: hypothetical protein [Caudoviricetes sp.]